MEIKAEETWQVEMHSQPVKQYKSRLRMYDKQKYTHSL